MDRRDLRASRGGTDTPHHDGIRPRNFFVKYCSGYIFQLSQNSPKLLTAKFTNDYIKPGILSPIFFAWKNRVDRITV